MTQEEFTKALKDKGFSNFEANYHANDLWYEQECNEFTQEEREWAYSRGFLAQQVREYGLTEENYKDYLGAYDYHKLDPIDPFTKRLVDGKLVLPYTIGGRFPQYLPKYYCWIFDENQIIPMGDNIIKDWESVEDYLKQLLDVVACLAIKPYTGGGGVGFVRLEKINNLYYSNGELIADFSEFVKQITDKYLVTEYIRQCHEFDEVFKDSVATLRVITINKNNIHKTFISYVRFGTKLSGGASNLCSGGVAVPFDWETGEFFGGFYRKMKFCNGGKFILDRHPDSNVSLVGKRLPHFDLVKKLVEDVCTFLSVHTYFGFDIMITEDGVKMCEINSHPALNLDQAMFGGVWKQDKFVVDFFKDLLEKYDKKVK